MQDLYYIAFGYPEKELNTDVALITGGGNGLGRQLAERLGKMGTKIVIWDINQKGKANREKEGESESWYLCNFHNLSGIAETVEIVQEAGGYCKGYVVDISKKEEVYKAADVIREEVGDVSTIRRRGAKGEETHLWNVRVNWSIKLL